MEYTNVVSLDNVDNRFLFVLIAARRALQIQKGARPRVDVGTKKPSVVAMAEVLNKLVEYQLPGAAKPKGRKSSK